MSTRLTPICAALCAAALLAAPMAQADDRQTQNPQQASTTPATWVEITAWNYTPLYRGWSANKLLDEEVYGRNGEEIGEVEDLIIGADGRIKKVVVEGGGFLDIGDSHVAVPWEQVKRYRSGAIKVPIAEGQLDDYGLFGNGEMLPPKPSEFRLREFLGDTVTAQGRGYGTVRDVIFGDDGRIQAIVVRPAYGYGYGVGPVALPYAGAYDPYRPYYEVPYTVADLKKLRPFDYSQFE